MLLLLIADAWAQACDPFGVRLSLGELYNPEPYGDPTNAFYISFNTATNCTPVTRLQNTVLNCSIEEVKISPEVNEVKYTFLTYIHVCPVKEIVAVSNQTFKFNYTIGSRAFTGSVPSVTQKLQNYLVVGDWGVFVAGKGYDEIQPCLESYLTQHDFSLVLFMGDMAYDLQTNDCDYYNLFLKQSQFLTSRLAFMIAPGNHDKYVRRNVSGTLFNRTYRMPQDALRTTSFYSFSVGRTHFVMYDPYDSIYGVASNETAEILGYLKEDYERQRKGIDWYIPFSHYPMYCSYVEDSDKHCQTNRDILRPFLNFFTEKGAQLYLSGHVHLYERMWPINNNTNLPQVSNETREDAGMNFTQYTYNGSTSYVVQGDAGNAYYMQLKQYNLTGLTARNGLNSGFGILTIYDSELLKYQRIKVGNSQLGKQCFVEDGFFIKDPASSLWWILLGVGVLLAALAAAGACFYCRKARPIVSEAEEGLIQT